MAGIVKFKPLRATPMIRAIYCAVCCLALSLTAEVCLAQTDGPIELSWDAPEGCPQQTEEQEQISTLVGALGATPQPNRLRVRGIIEPFNERYRLTLLIERNTTHGTRVIESDDCHSLGKAAAVVLGLLVRREISSGRELTESEISGQPEAPKPRVGTSTKPPSEKPTAASQAPSASPASPWRLLIHGPQVSVDLWTLPRKNIGAGAGAGIAYYDWRAFVSGGIWTSQSTTSTGVQPYQADFRRWSLEAWVCRGAKLNPFEIAPCGLLAFDDVNARASGGGRVPRARSVAWLSVGAGISGYWHINRHFSFVVSGSGRMMTVRPEFLVEGFAGEGRAYKVPLGTFVSSLGFEFIF